MVELHEFVKGTLVAILPGVRDAQNESSEYGGFVNPQHGMGDTWTFHQRTSTSIQSVEFDVAVTATEMTGVGGGLKLSIPVISADAGTKSEASEVTTNRIKFTVPVAYPPAPDVKATK